MNADSTPLPAAASMSSRRHRTSCSVLCCSSLRPRRRRMVAAASDARPRSWNTRCWWPPTSRPRSRSRPMAASGSPSTSANGVGLVRDGEDRSGAQSRARNVDAARYSASMPSGAAWFTDPPTIAILRIIAVRRSEIVSAGNADCAAGGLAVAPDGGVWFAEIRPTASRASRTACSTATRSSRCVADRTALPSAPDGTVWATLQSGNQLLRIAPRGEMTEYDLPDARALADRRGGRCARRRVDPRIPRQQDRRVSRTASSPSIPLAEGQGRRPGSPLLPMGPSGSACCAAQHWAGCATGRSRPFSCRAKTRGPTALPRTRRATCGTRTSGVIVGMLPARSARARS